MSQSETMKKLIFPILFLNGILFSCSDSSKEFELAAKEFCECMEEGEVDGEDAASVNMNVGLCLLDSKVYLKSPEMVKQVNEQCPQFKSSFEDFVKELK